MGNERVVEVLKIVSHLTFLDAFIERSSRVPRTGLAFRGAEHQGLQGSCPVNSVSWRDHETHEGLRPGHNSTEFCGAEHDEGFLSGQSSTAFWSWRQSSTALGEADHLVFLLEPSSTVFGAAHHLGQHGFLPGQSSTALGGAHHLGQQGFSPWTGFNCALWRISLRWWTWRRSWWSAGDQSLSGMQTASPGRYTNTGRRGEAGARATDPGADRGPGRGGGTGGWRSCDHAARVPAVLSYVNASQTRSLHPTLGSWSMLSPKQAAQPNPSCPALCRQDTHISMAHRQQRKHL